MDPVALEKAFEIYPDVKVIVVAHLYGTPGKIDETDQLLTLTVLSLWRMRQNPWGRLTKENRQVASEITAVSVLRETTSLRRIVRKLICNK